MSKIINILILLTLSISLFSPSLLYAEKRKSRHYKYEDKNNNGINDYREKRKFYFKKRKIKKKMRKKKKHSQMKKRAKKVKENDDGRSKRK